jgi:hypothetical protein
VRQTDQNARPVLAGIYSDRGWNKRVMVEVPGIEPGSFVALMGLLRAQCAASLLGLTSHAHKLV